MKVRKGTTCWPVVKYAEILIEGVMDRRDELDETIAAALDNWRPERVGALERNVIRVGLYEMRCCDDVPEAVAISEAVEVTKRFGSDEAPGFVNGVLDRLKQT